MNKNEPPCGCGCGRSCLITDQQIVDKSAHECDAKAAREVQAAKALKGKKPAPPAYEPSVWYIVGHSPGHIPGRIWLAEPAPAPRP